jgi:hypothetical protein
MSVVNWLRANVDLFMLLGMAIVVAAGWLAAELADEVLEGSAQKYDEWILRHLRTPGSMTDPIGPKLVRGPGGTSPRWAASPC